MERFLICMPPLPPAPAPHFLLTLKCIWPPPFPSRHISRSLLVLMQGRSGKGCMLARLLPFNVTQEEKKGCSPHQTLLTINCDGAKRCSHQK